MKIIGGAFHLTRRIASYGIKEVLPAIGIPFPCNYLVLFVWAYWMAALAYRLIAHVH